MRRLEYVSSEQDFAEFFRSAYQPLLRDVIFVSGNLQEAEDALSAAMLEVLAGWDRINNPRGYARRAAISHLIKNKQRGLKRTQHRLIEQGQVPATHGLDPGLSAWDEQEWVTQLLKSLPSAQREVLACMIDQFSRKETAQILGKTEAAVRQNLRAARKKLVAFLTEGDR
jgi:RNA polymerase sigma factor (sigma-70 family)